MDHGFPRARLARPADESARRRLPLDHGYLFHRLVVMLERVVYTVDEWLRFRAGDNRQAESGQAGRRCLLVFRRLLDRVRVHAAGGAADQPDQTLSRGDRLSQTDPAHRTRARGASCSRTWVQARATTLVWSTIWLIPGVFGFLVWELKGNWRLYAANRPRTLVPVPIGHHGETVGGLAATRSFIPGPFPNSTPDCGGRRRRRNSRATGSRSTANDWRCIECRRRFGDSSSAI